MSAKQLEPVSITSPFRVGEWLADPALDQISRNGEVIKLEPRTMRLLVRLAEAPAQVVSSQQLLESVWTGVIVGPASVYQAVSQLRKLLGDTDPAPTYIATVPRKGYRLIAPVEPGATSVGTSTIDVAQTGTVPAIDSAPGTRSRWKPYAGWGTLAVVLIAVVAVAATALRSYSLRDASPATLVVLPFVDMTADKNNAAFCDGLTEELSSVLSQLPSLRVVARTSAFAIRDQGIDIREIGRKVSATHALEGTVRRSGDIVRVTAQLIDARRGYRSWSASYDLPIRDVLRLQREIAQAVAAELEIRFPQQSLGRVAARSSADPQAYELYLLGRHEFRQRSRDSNAKAIDLYQRAIARDRKFALAYVGLAQAQMNDAWIAGESPGDSQEQILATIDTALRLQPELADAYVARGMLRADWGQPALAAPDLRRALELDPGNAQAMASLGRVYQAQALPLQALDRFDRAVQLDPLDFMRYVDRCSVSLEVGRSSMAAADCRMARELQPDSEWGFIFSAWLARSEGRTADSLRWTDLALRIVPTRIDLHLDRINQLLDLGLAPQAQAAIGQALEMFPNDLSLRVMAVDALIRQQRIDDARAALEVIEPGTAGADDLLLAAEVCLEAGAEPLARRFAEQAAAAPDFTLSNAIEARDAIWGQSSELLYAWLERASGDNSASTDRVRRVLALLQELKEAGYTTWGLDWVRARALATAGDDQGAMQALEQAADRGWRSSRLARTWPAFAPLAAAESFRRLMQQTDELTATERERYLLLASTDVDPPR